DSSLSHVRHAQMLLGPATWSRVIHIANSTRDGRYPRELHALVFEVAGLLWFYTPGEGTQSFSLHQGNLPAEKADFAPLLRDIDPGFLRWREVRGSGVTLARGARLPNGCFIESLVALRERLLAGEPMESPRLLSYYRKTSSGLLGHTVLAYRRGDRIAVYDHAQFDQRERLFSAQLAAPLPLARALEGRSVVRAREILLDVAVETTIAEAGALTGAGAVAMR
ncbi:MAG TPA: hypothetical protein VGE76_18660, partial [Opitutaceae bacterium]